MTITTDSIIFSYQALPGVKRTILDNPAQCVIDEVTQNLDASNIRMTVFDSKLQMILVFRFNAGEWHEISNRDSKTIAS